MGRGRAKRLAEVRARGGQLADARIALNVALLRWAVQSSCPSMVPCDSWKLGHPAFLSEGIAAAECLLCPSYLRPVSHQREETLLPRQQRGSRRSARQRICASVLLQAAQTNLQSIVSRHSNGVEAGARAEWCAPTDAASIPRGEGAAGAVVGGAEKACRRHQNR